MNGSLIVGVIARFGWLIEIIRLGAMWFRSLCSRNKTEAAFATPANRPASR
jgi:hypothetical protein